MATVTHGLQDGIDEILEKTRALERMLGARKVELGVGDESKRAIIDAALASVAGLRNQATLTRSTIESVNLSLRDR
jgi:hypothetical protein